jgi:hypothetical protein
MSVVLESALGLIFIYFIFSSVCSGLNELLAQLLNKRADFLEAAIWQLLDARAPTNDVAPGVAPGEYFGRFWKHDLIQQLTSPLRDSWIRGLGRSFQRWHNGWSKRATLIVITEARKLATAPSEPGKHLRPLVPPSGTNTVGAAVPLKRPSYIDAKTFGAVVMATVFADHDHPGQLAEIGDRINELSGSKLGNSLQALWMSADHDLTTFRTNIESWFNGEMDRASGWYKRETKKILVILSLVFVLFVNIDSVAIARTLWSDPQTRNAVAVAAQAQVNASATSTAVTAPRATTVPASGAPAPICPPTTTDNSSTSTTATTSALKGAIACIKSVRSLGVPLGWSLPACKDPAKCPSLLNRLGDGIKSGWHQPVGSMLLKALGLILSVIALSMGAPFWWDLLNRFGSLQSAGPAPKPAPPAPPGPRGPAGPPGPPGPPGPGA